jgi:hypothetical protein
MAIGIMVIMLLLAALIGGYTNYLLPTNMSADGKSKLRSVRDCILLGLTATVMVPLFLELAQSKLLEDVRFSFNWQAPAHNQSEAKVDTLVIKTETSVDSASVRKTTSDTTLRKAKAATDSAGNADASGHDLGKNYLLWAAYCMLAGAAGFRFIDMLINNVVKQDQINILKTENKELSDKTAKETLQNQVNAQAAEQKVNEELAKANAARFNANSGAVDRAPLVPDIGPITHPDDPQKGRFGGVAEKNFRRLAAAVKKSMIPNFYSVSIWVESTDPENHPLTEDVIFYIHDSFRPNVYPIKPDGNRAEDSDILSYGAFTVGAVVDLGATLLELDLADDTTFPKGFRES